MHNEAFWIEVPKRYDRGEKIAAVFHQTSVAACPSKPHESCNSFTKKKNTHLFAMLNRWMCFGHVISHSSRMHKGCHGVGIHLASAVYNHFIQRFSFIPSVWQVDVAIWVFCCETWQVLKVILTQHAQNV